jgi:hypothetical protein
MSDLNCTATRLHEQQLDVFLTPQVAAQHAGVHEGTIRTHAKADAWRRDRDGALHPLYFESTILAFAKSYRDGRRKTAGGAR